MRLGLLSFLLGAVLLGAVLAPPGGAAAPALREATLAVTGMT